MPSCSLLRSPRSFGCDLAKDSALQKLSGDEDGVVAAVDFGVSGSSCASEKRLRLLGRISAGILGFFDDGELLLLLP